MDWLGWALAIVVGGTVLLLYVYVPLKIRKESWIAANPRFIDVDASDSRISAGTRAFFHDVARDLKPLGFRPVVWAINPDGIKDTVGFLAIFENLAEQTAGCGMVIETEVPTGAKHRNYSFEFSTSYTDGTELETNNTDASSGFSPPAWREGCKIAGLGDLALLFRIHQHLASKLHHRGVEPLPAPDGAIGAVRDSVRRECAEYVRRGLVTPAEDGHRYRYTVKGTYTLVWAQLWPLKQIIRGRYRNSARRVLRELGVSEEYETVDYAKKYGAVEEEIETAELVEGSGSG